MDLVEPSHYSHNKETDQITFNKEDRFYKLERDVFAANGVDIDKVENFEVYSDYWILFRHQINAVFTAQVRNKKPKTLISKLVRSTIIEDETETERLKTIIAKKNQLRLKS